MAGAGDDETPAGAGGEGKEGGEILRRKEKCRMISRLYFNPSAHDRAECRCESA